MWARFFIPKVHIIPDSPCLTSIRDLMLLEESEASRIPARTFMFAMGDLQTL